MESLKYYEDLDNNFLIAHDKYTEFFASYNSETKTWKRCNISFSNFKHDYNYREVSKEEIIERTGGTLPESIFKEYLSTFFNNMSGPSNG